MTTIKKFIRDDGKVAVLYSPGYGAGWYTWHKSLPQLVYDPVIVAALLIDDRAAALAYAEKEYGEDVYFGGFDDLRIEWLDPDTVFEITEYDGAESVRVIKQEAFFVA